ncbi:hypothetical protein [Curtobacterium sp. MCSS17_007]|uniref:hypothetical protein n=1 Tax=Curtobacterium sp. MCSS17_007 TaxID=2175646 RepID=UPI000DA6FF08|nr:hypothetical protein [Curtobacterium sp. MCSS17_007]WIE75195.1 hypothetical protein DEJ22_013180 [Curtobacterium sp. MCSS17_007]
MTGQPISADQHLALTSVVTSGLPTTLGTQHAEHFYDVPAVFNRRPSPPEVAALEASTSHKTLERSGYPEVTLAVHDRRLVIGHTNLDQLERGLATALANLVHQISGDALAKARQSRDNAQLARDEQLARAQDVTRAAERIRFVPDEQLRAL